MNKKDKSPEWFITACNNAMKYLVRFVNNPGLEHIVKEFDTGYALIKDPNKRIDYLSNLAAEHWDFRKGRERFEVTETQPIDEPGSELGETIMEGARRLEMATSSTATLKHYSIMAILGGANMSPYYRLRYALEQHVTYDMLVYLGSEREIHPPEQEITKSYALGVRTEFDLGKGAITSLMGSQLADGAEYDLITSEWHIAHLQRKDGLPIFLLSAPPFLGNGRANTADTYDFMRRIEQEALSPTKNILFATGSMYRYAQYFDAVREMSLRTGVDIEVIGFDPSYTNTQFKPSQFLQELKAAANAAVRLRDAIEGNAVKNEWRDRYYNRFERDEADRP